MITMKMVVSFSIALVTILFLSLEKIWEPPVRFKNNAEKFGYKKEDAVLFRIGEIKKLEDLIN